MADESCPTGSPRGAHWLPIGAGIGTALGAAAGTLFGHIALGAGIGTALGVGIGTALMAVKLRTSSRR